MLLTSKNMTGKSSELLMVTSKMVARGGTLLRGNNNERYRWRGSSGARSLIRGRHVGLLRGN